VKTAINEYDDLDELDEDGNTALHLAAERGHLEIVKLLAEHGADHQVRNAQGQTATDVAASKANKAVVEYLSSLSLMDIEDRP
jgi:ankyrin repeat protein